MILILYLWDLKEIPEGGGYENRCFSGAERNRQKL